MHVTWLLIGWYRRTLQLSSNQRAAYIAIWPSFLKWGHDACAFAPSRYHFANTTTTTNGKETKIICVHPTQKALLCVFLNWFHFKRYQSMLQRPFFVHVHPPSCHISMIFTLQRGDPAAKKTNKKQNFKIRILSPFQLFS